MAQQLIVDSRLPESNAPPNDPSNPRNVIRGLLTVAAQTNADTKYDAIPPPRVEAFTDITGAYKYFFFALVIAATAILLLLTPRPFVIKIALALLAIYALHYAARRLANRAV
jgi:hypothetical protein